MQEPPVSRNNNISSLTPPLSLEFPAQIPQPHARRPRALLERLDARRPRRPGAGLVVPPLGDEAQVGPAPELGRQHLRLGPDVAGERRHLLHERLRDDFQAGVDGRAERLLARLEGAPHGRGHQVGEAVVVREAGAQGGALFLARGRQVGVWDLLVDHCEVVEALGVADEVDGDGHVGLGFVVCSGRGSEVSGCVDLFGDVTYELVGMINMPLALGSIEEDEKRC